MVEKGHQIDPSKSDPKNEEKLLKEQTEVVIESEAIPTLLYKVTDSVPIRLAIFFAFQQALIALSTSLAVSSFVADLACASEFPDIKRDLLSTTLLMNGVTTLMMVTIGARLPLYQGATADYVVPLLAMRNANPDACKLQEELNTLGVSTNVSTNIEDIGISFYQNTTNLSLKEKKREQALSKLQEGCLILVGVIHCLVGLTGAAGLLLKLIGPVTIVPAILLVGIFISRAAVNTAAIALIVSLYLAKRKTPCPAWSRKKGFHIFWYPFHQVFAILIGLLAGWAMSAIMTVSGVLTDDPSIPEYMARTDAQADIIARANWFKVPYPNQFGAPSFNMGVFIAFFIGTLTSILDSIGDYYACARTCNVPPPPRYAVNRGLAVEGFGSTLSGLLGCGHATTTYGGNIGAMGLTKVASRDVLIWTAFIYIVFGLVGKISAVFITIPLPVLGGVMIVMFGMFNGIALSNLQVISLSSTRNLAIIGTSLLVGLMVPYWLEMYPEALNTGNAYSDNIVKTIAANPILIGGVLAAFLDNTVPGTAEERGITAWQEPEKSNVIQKYSEGLEVYVPLLPTRWLSWRIMKYLPFCQYRPREDTNEED